MRTKEQREKSRKELDTGQDPTLGVRLVDADVLKDVLADSRDLERENVSLQGENEQLRREIDRLWRNDPTRRWPHPWEVPDMPPRLWCANG